MTETSRKPPRSRISEAEEQRMAELYKSGEYSLRDIADQFDTNPTSVSRILKAAGVEMRKPGVSDLAIRNMKRNNKIRAEQRKREAEVRLAEEIAAARRRERVDAKADEIAAVNPGSTVFGALLQEEARASVALDGETHAVGDPMDDYVAKANESYAEAQRNRSQSPDEPIAEIRWQPREGEHIAHAQTIAERVHQVDELLAEAGFFSGQTEHGHLVWQPGPSNAGKTFFPQPPVPDLGSFVEEEPKVEEARAQGYLLAQEEQAQARRADYTEQALEELSAEHRAELDRVHAWSKEQWGAGVRHGYESATNGVADLLRECIKETAGHAAEALTEFLEMLEDGEHFYRQRKDKKPWLNPRNWEER